MMRLTIRLEDGQAAMDCTGCKTAYGEEMCHLLRCRNRLKDRLAEYEDKVEKGELVEVVRCKDCVNYCGFEHCKNGICDVDSVSKRAVCPDDFCSYGERKDYEDSTDNYDMSLCY